MSCATVDWFFEDPTFTLIDELFCELVRSDEWYLELAQCPEEREDNKHGVWYTHTLTKKTVEATLVDLNDKTTPQYLHLYYGGYWV